MVIEILLLAAGVALAYGALFFIAVTLVSQITVLQEAQHTKHPIPFEGGFTMHKFIFALLCMYLVFIVCAVGAFKILTRTIDTNPYLLLVYGGWHLVGFAIGLVHMSRRGVLLSPGGRTDWVALVETFFSAAIGPFVVLKMIKRPTNPSPPKAV